MKPLMLAAVCQIVYATFNVVIVDGQPNQSPLLRIWLFHTGAAIVALPMVFMVPRASILPINWWACLGGAALIIAADVLYFSAYKLGGNIVTITPLIVLVPFFSYWLKFALGGPRPSLQQIGGMALLGVGLVLVLRQPSQ